VRLGEGADAAAAVEPAEFAHRKGGQLPPAGGGESAGRAQLNQRPQPNGTETGGEQRRGGGRHRPDAHGRPGHIGGQPDPGLRGLQGEHGAAGEVALVGEVTGVEAWGVLLAGDSQQALEEPLEDEPPRAQPPQPLARPIQH